MRWLGALNGRCLSMLLVAACWTPETLMAQTSHPRRLSIQTICPLAYPAVNLQEREVSRELRRLESEVGAVEREPKVNAAAMRIQGVIRRFLDVASRVDMLTMCAEPLQSTMEMVAERERLIARLQSVLARLASQVSQRQLLVDIASAAGRMGRFFPSRRESFAGVARVAMMRSRLFQ